MTLYCIIVSSWDGLRYTADNVLVFDSEEKRDEVSKKLRARKNADYDYLDCETELNQEY